MQATISLRRWNDTLLIFCVASAFAQQDSNAADTAIPEVTGNGINTASWETRDLPNIRLRFKLPPDYKEKQWAVIVGTPGPRATFQLGHEDEINFVVENAGDGTTQNAKVMPQKDYIDYKEWSQLMGGRKGIVQTFQGGGVIIDEQGKRLPYGVEATCALDDKRLLWDPCDLGKSRTAAGGSCNAQNDRILLIRPSGFSEPDVLNGAQRRGYSAVRYEADSMKSIRLRGISLLSTPRLRHLFSRD